jgi:hypothetical protein
MEEGEVVVVGTVVVMAAAVEAAIAPENVTEAAVVVEARGTGGKTTPLLAITPRQASTLNAILAKQQECMSGTLAIRVK